ncbi:MAG: protein kinase [Deltaproteobacteria bacterium]|nr:protein kinase [Deltaproteobacteria bacterium]
MRKENGRGRPDSRYRAPRVVAAPLDPLIGTVLDERYQVVEPIGAGGTGTVYRCEHLRLGRDVAVKVLSAQLNGDEPATLRFGNEVRIISKLRHPRTLRLLDSGVTVDGRPYLVMDLLTGETLQSRLRRGRLDLSETLRILIELCDALEEAHGLDIVHRDLKPANVFLESVGNQQLVRVLDFGLAKVLNAPGITAPLSVFGTPGYMAPEQIWAKAIDSRTDIYAVGVIAYECLSGSAPFEASGALALLLKHAQSIPGRLTETVGCEDVDPRLDDLVWRMLQKEPDDRPASIGLVRAVLAEVQRGARKPSETTQPRPGPERPEAPETDPSSEEMTARDADPYAEETEASYAEVTEVSDPPTGASVASDRPSPASAAGNPPSLGEAVTLRPPTQSPTRRLWIAVAAILGATLGAVVARVFL